MFLKFLLKNKLWILISENVLNIKYAYPVGIAKNIDWCIKVNTINIFSSYILVYYF